MKLSEIYDVFGLRVQHDEVEHVEDQLVLPWEIYQDDKPPQRGKLTVKVFGELELDPRFKQSKLRYDEEDEDPPTLYSISDVEIVKLEVGGKTYDEKEAMATFGDYLEKDLILDSVKDEMKDKKMYTFKK